MPNGLRLTWRSGLVGLGVTVACASAPRLATDPPTLLIRVEHRSDPSTPMDVWAVPAHGRRLRLGMLTTGTSNVVRFDRVDPTMQYRFTAEPHGGARVVSAPFVPGKAGVVVWDLSANTLTPAPGAPPP